MQETIAMTHAEATNHIRSRIKAAGIKASVRKMVICGSMRISVSTASYDQAFTGIEQETINRIARVNGFTLTRGMVIEDSKPFGNEGEFVWRG